MNKAIGVQLLGYGATLIGLSGLVFLLARPLAMPTLVTGLAGGVLCLVAGIRAVQGITGKALPLLTVIPVTIVLVSQTVMTWGASTPDIPARRSATAVIGLLLAISYLMLLRLVYAGTTPVGHPSESGKNDAKPR